MPRKICGHTGGSVPSTRSILQLVRTTIVPSGETKFVLSLYRIAMYRVGFAESPLEAPDLHSPCAGVQVSKKRHAAAMT